MRRFIMIVDDATPEQQNAITKSLEGKPQGFWHYFSDVWLIIDASNTCTTISLRDHLSQVVPGATTLILPIDNANEWQGFGKQDTFKWLHDTWPK